ncbi:hypothetical protein ISN44_As10g018300, partial [Arabidopsis suecica]
MGSASWHLFSLEQISIFKVVGINTTFSGRERCGFSMGNMNASRKLLQEKRIFIKFMIGTHAVS